MAAQAATRQSPPLHPPTLQPTMTAIIPIKPPHHHRPILLDGVFITPFDLPTPRLPPQSRLWPLRITKQTQRQRHHKHHLSLNERGQDGRSEKAFMLAPQQDTMGPPQIIYFTYLPEGFYTLPFCLPPTLKQPSPS